ncbi:BglG family transcription antiterminator [Oceanivirga salmonicida]|uniref:BglG family transcription antiterminator n=1 Tax=Oceanivirga salmonicida TaxID=1769291 RepID=UPI00082E7D24|nr:PTS sugar transporter subunit IIA [Oceanivirga salmonicida]
MLNNRELDILKICSTSNINNINIEYFLSKFGISIRAFQYNINNINFYLSNNNYDKILTKKGKVIFLRNQIKNFLINFNNLDLSRDEKLNIVYLYLLFNDKGLNVTRLANKIKVSRNTLKSYMNNLDNKLEYVHGKGYFLRKNNIYKAKKLFNIINNENLYSYMEEVIDKDLYHKIKKFIVELNKKIELNLDENTYKQILSYIYCLIKYPDNSEVINNFLSVDEKIIELTIKKYFGNIKSINQIIDLFIGVSLTDNIEYWLNESFLLGKIIKNVSNQIDFDLTNDKILYDFLLSHIKVCIYRLKKNIVLNNGTYRDLILEDDPLIKVVKNAVKEMEQTFNIKFTETEISLLVFHFKASIERLKHSSVKKVVLVCGMGYGSSKVLEYNLKENFDIDIVDVLPVHLLNEKILKKDNIDYILTTVDLDIDAIKINPQLKVEDYQKILKLGIKRKKYKISVDDFITEIENIKNTKNLKKYLLDKYKNIFYQENKNIDDIESILTKEKVIFKNKVNTWQEAINIVGNNLEKIGATMPKYKNKMIENINRLGPYVVIENGIAIPHANIMDGVLKTDISILILKENISFNAEKSARIFFAFSSINKDAHLGILNNLYNLILRPNFLEKIDKIDTYEKFKEYILKGEYGNV